MAMERVGALEARVDAAETRLAQSEAALAAYRGAMPTPYGYYVLLEQEPWSSQAEKAEQLPHLRRRVLTAVASAAHMPSEFRVRCFQGRYHDRFVAVLLISCGTMMTPTHDVAAMYAAVLRCGLSLVQWHTIMSGIEMTHFEYNMNCAVAHLPVPIRAFVNTFFDATADATVGFYRFSNNPLSFGADEQEGDIDRAEDWAELTNCRFFIQQPAHDD